MVVRKGKFMCLRVLLVYYLFIFVVAASVKERWVLSFFRAVSFLFFFPRGKGYFHFLVGEVRDSSSAGQSMTYVFILEAYNSLEGMLEGLGVSKESLLTIVYFL